MSLGVIMIVSIIRRPWPIRAVLPWQKQSCTMPCNAVQGTRLRTGRSQHPDLRSWYREGMHALVSRWRKAVDLDGDYVEKEHV